MKPRNISYLLAFCVSAGICFSSPVFAKASKNADAKASLEAAGLEKQHAVDVMFKDETMAKSADEPFCSLDTKIDKYQKGTLIGTAKDGLAEIEVNGKIAYVLPDTFAYGPVEIKKLETKKAEEEAAKKKAEEEAARKKAEEEAAKKKAEEEKRRQEEEAAKAAAQAKAEEEAAAQQAAAAPVQSVTVPSYSGGCLTPSAGVFQGPSGKESYYNLNMDGVISIMRGMGNNDPYWVRSDGVKMLGNYVMVAANLSIRPRGSLVATSLGTGIVVDTGSFAASNPTQLDIAVAW